MLSTSQPFSFILFGASGHLAKLKIYPALYVLALKKRLPPDYAIVGFARTNLDTASFRALVEAAVREAFAEVTQRALDDFLAHCHYHQGPYDAPASYDTLTKRLQTLEKSWKDCTRIAYLSVPPSVFGTVLQNLSSGGVHDHKGKGGFRCIVEKPVGNDLKSFEEIHTTLQSCFHEEDVFLLDHYLGKEAVRNIYYLRFANPILERILKNTLIRHVEIMASEQGGLEGRAGYFDATGTLRDMVQSHLFMTMSLLTMRLHEESSFRESRRNALEQIYLPPAADLSHVILQGQYGQGVVGEQAVSGYRQEKDVPTDSTTNTFICLKLMTRMSKWEGVPFYLRTGKRLNKKETRISIEFQVPHPVGKGATPNRLDIILQGEAGMRMYLQTKISGTSPEFRSLVLEDPLVCVGDCLPEHSLLLLEAIHGKQQWYLGFDEVRAAWRLIDPLQSPLTGRNLPLYPYTAGTAGPREMDEWIGRDGLSWFS